MTEATEPKPPAPDDADIRARIARLPRRIFTNEALAGLLFLALGGVGVALGTDRLDGRVDSRVDAGVAVDRERLDRHIIEEREHRAAVEARMQRFESLVERVESKADAKEERDARRFEALSNTIIQRREQPESAELSRPVTRDGGR